MFSNKIVHKNYLFFSTISILIIGFQIIIKIIIIVSIYMVIKISFYKYTKISHISLLIFLISGFISTLSTILLNYDLIGAWELSYLTNIILCGSFFMFPILAYLEEKLILSKQLIRSEKEKADTFFELAADILVGLDRQGNITLINKKGLNIFNYKKNEIIGLNFFDYCRGFFYTLTKKDHKEINLLRMRLHFRI